MNILRLSTLTLGLAIAVFALSYNPSFADNPKKGDCKPNHCDHGDEPSDTIDITVELVGGAFVFHEGAAKVTPESVDNLSGAVQVHMIRPGGAEAHHHDACATDDTAINTLCLIWNDVFDLCGLLGTTGAEDVPEFTVLLGKKSGWEVARVVDKVSVGFGFELDSPLSDDPLSVSLQLIGPCIDGPCELIPIADGTPKEIPLDRFRIHLRGKGGVTHNAACHAENDFFLAGGDLKLRITAKTP